MYPQVIWGFKKGWTTGIRGDVLQMQNSAYTDDPTRPSRSRVSGDITWYPTEFSKLRLQYQITIFWMRTIFSRQVRPIPFSSSSNSSSERTVPTSSDLVKKIKPLCISCTLFAALLRFGSGQDQRRRDAAGLRRDHAREIGGDNVDVTVLAKPTEDPHFVDARPSFVVKLRQADVLIDGGAELEIGWLPPLLQNARNPKIENLVSPAGFRPRWEFGSWKCRSS